MTLRPLAARAALAWLVPALAPVQSRPATIRVGDAPEVVLESGPLGAMLRLEVAEAEPLTLLVESYDADVRLRVEDAAGAALAEDDDSGVESNVLVEWSPMEPGTYVMRVTAKEPASGVATVWVLRGAMLPQVANERLAAIAYWERARDRAKSRGDTAREAIARQRLADRDGQDRLARAGDPRASRDEALAKARALLVEAESLAKDVRLDVARARAKAAFDLLGEVQGAADDALAVDLCWSLANVAIESGDLRAAKDAYAAVARFFDATLPKEHPFALRSKSNLANAMRQLGELASARSLEEAVLAAQERRLPAGHLDLLATRQNLGVTLFRMGELARARALLESVMTARERAGPEDDLELQETRVALAGILGSSGDFAEARALLEKALAVYERKLPADHRRIQGARQNLSQVLRKAGDRRGARAALEQVVATMERTLPEDHPDLQRARHNLAGLLAEMGDPAGSRRLEEKVLASRERTLPEDHPDVRASLRGVAASAWRLGDYEGARALLERVVASLERSGRNPLELRSARLGLASALASLGKNESLSPILLDVARAARAQLADFVRLSVREIGERAFDQLDHLSSALSLAARAKRTVELDQELFAWAEELRALASCDDARNRWMNDVPEVASRREAVFAARQRLADLVAGLGDRSASGRPTPGAISDAARARDQAERALREAIDTGVAFVPALDPPSLARALAPKSAVAGYFVVRSTRASHDKVDTESARFIVHVLMSDGGLRRIELGAAEPIRTAVANWREAIGAPLDSRGVSGVASAPAEKALQAGERLRALALDPVLKAAGDAKCLHVCLADALHLVPLEALPLGRGVVGDEVQIRVETALTRLLSPPVPSFGATAFLGLGGVSYDAEFVREEAPLDRAFTPPPVRADRGASGRIAFPPLRATRAEVEAIRDLFAAASLGPATVLQGDDATKSRFVAAASRATHLHLATHGYFTTESVRSNADGAIDTTPIERASLEEVVKGFAPMSLCGLAFAGANRGANARGQVPGILTAEELAGLDLHRCDLAVLSACETHVGIRRGGEGIASLQSALHGAGVRSAITSLWRVPDEATRELMVDFYRRLWIERRPKADALWEAKRALRSKGAPTMAWAAWVFTGDPGTHR